MSAISENLEHGAPDRISVAQGVRHLEECGDKGTITGPPLKAPGRASESDNNDKGTHDTAQSESSKGKRPSHQSNQAWIDLVELQNRWEGQTHHPCRYGGRTRIPSPQSRPVCHFCQFQSPVIVYLSKPCLTNLSAGNCLHQKQGRTPHLANRRIRKAL